MYLLLEGEGDMESLQPATAVSRAAGSLLYGATLSTRR
jgi:hypothetical protein